MWRNIETEHEIKFKQQGIKIKAGIFANGAGSDSHIETQ